MRRKKQFVDLFCLVVSSRDGVPFLHQHSLERVVHRRRARVPRRARSTPAELPRACARTCARASPAVERPPRAAPSAADLVLGHAERDERVARVDPRVAQRAEADAQDLGRARIVVALVHVQVRTARARGGRGEVSERVCVCVCVRVSACVFVRVRVRASASAFAGPSVFACVLFSRLFSSCQGFCEKALG